MYRVNLIYAPLAQLVEQLTLNQWVLGSSPRWCTKNEAVAQGKNPSAAASLRLNASRSAKTLAIDPLISKKQITQTGPSEKRLFSRGACFPNFQKSEIQVCFRLNQMQILQSTVALCQQVSNVLGKSQKQKLRQNFDFTAGKETLEIPIVL